MKTSNTRFNADKRDYARLQVKRMLYAQANGLDIFCLLGQIRKRLY